MPKMTLPRTWLAAGCAAALAAGAATLAPVSAAAAPGLPGAPRAATVSVATSPRPPHAAAASSLGPRLKPVVRSAARHDLSASLRSMKPYRPPKRSKVRMIPNLNPLQARARHAVPADPGGRTAVQRTAGPDTMPSFQQNFEGIDFGEPGNPCQCLPPDTNGAVGPTDYVQTVNTSLAVWSKSGQLRFGPVDLATLWQGFAGACDPSADPAYADGGDVVVLYDDAANRWIISQLSIQGFLTGSGTDDECIAVSQTGDPTGAYYRYDFPVKDFGLSSLDLNDYPKFAVWPDAYYMSFNDFAGPQSNGTFIGPVAVAFDRAAMLAGQQATVVAFPVTNPNYSYLLPSNWEGGALGEAPPAGAPNPFVMSCDANTGGPCTSDQIDEWDFHVDWSSPSSSTFGNNGTPSTALPTENFNGNLCGFSRDCIPQPGTGQGIDPGSDKLMYQAAYRDIGGTPTIALSQTISAGGGQAGINWYELNNGGSGWAIADQGAYAPNSDNRFMPSANIDASGDLAVGYSVSSSSVFPSIAVAGRLATDPLGQLTQGESTLIAGGGSQTGGTRWGDYSAMQVDPTDGCTFWYTNEYYSATSDVGWQTRIGSFTYPSCSFTHGTVSGRVTSASTDQPIAGATVTADGVTIPTGADGSYSMNLPPGTAQVTASDYGYEAQTASVTVTAGQMAMQNFQLTVVPHETVSGTVAAGSGMAWPLYAKVSWTDGNRHGGRTYTNPATGKYSLSLLENGSYTLTVTPLYPGYTVPAATKVSVGTSNVIQDFAAGVDLLACTAIGYHPVLSGGTTQPFTGTSPPVGWRVTNINLHYAGYSNTPGWVFTNPAKRANRTGGTGNFAIVDSAYDGPHHYQDTELTSPAVNLSADKTPVVQFATDLEGAINSTATVDLSTDGGKTWAPIWRSSGITGVPGPAAVVVPVPQATGKAKVKVRFTYTGEDSAWWEIDNAFLGNRACQQQTGGLVVGRVADSSGNGIDGATVASVNNPSERAITVATPGDTAVNGGMYDLFVTETGGQQFTASDTGYTASAQSVTITAGRVSMLDFSLAKAAGGAGVRTRAPR